MPTKFSRLIVLNIGIPYLLNLVLTVSLSLISNFKLICSFKVVSKSWYSQANVYPNSWNIFRCSITLLVNTLALNTWWKSAKFLKCSLTRHVQYPWHYDRWWLSHHPRTKLSFCKLDSMVLVLPNKYLEICAQTTQCCRECPQMNRQAVFYKHRLRFELNFLVYSGARPNYAQ